MCQHEIKKGAKLLLPAVKVFWSNAATKFALGIFHLHFPFYGNWLEAWKSHSSNNLLWGMQQKLGEKIHFQFEFNFKASAEEGLSKSCFSPWFIIKMFSFFSKLYFSSKCFKKIWIKLFWFVRICFYFWLSDSHKEKPPAFNK